MSTEQRREAHRHKPAAALLLLPLLSSFPSPAARGQGLPGAFLPCQTGTRSTPSPELLAAYRVDAVLLLLAVIILTQSKIIVMARLCLALEGKQARRWGVADSAIVWDRAAARAASKLCSSASLLLIRGGCGMRAEGEYKLHSTLSLLGE